MYKQKKNTQTLVNEYMGRTGPEATTRTKENSNDRTEGKHKHKNNIKDKKINNFSPTTSGKRTIYWEAVFGLI